MISIISHARLATLLVAGFPALVGITGAVAQQSPGPQVSTSARTSFATSTAPATLREVLQTIETRSPDVLAAHAVTLYDHRYRGVVRPRLWMIDVSRRLALTKELHVRHLR